MKLSDYRNNKSCGKRKRCCQVPPPDLWQKGGYKFLKQNLYIDEGSPKIYVTLYNQDWLNPNWCADPDFLRKALNAIKELVKINNGAFSMENAEKWFGKGVKKDTITSGVTKLNTYLQSTLANITFQCTLDWGMASMDQKFYRGHKSHPKCRLDRGYYWDRYSNGEMIASILHEMIHCVLDENKAWKNDGDTCGGMTDCLALAKNDQATALVNVDNWTLYLFEKKGALSNAGTIDWKYMDQQSFSKRTPLEDGQAAPTYK